MRVSTAIPRRFDRSEGAQVGADLLEGANTTASSVGYLSGCMFFK
jgi:hypothetical protein